MILTGTATVPAASGEGRPAASGTGLSVSQCLGRQPLPLQRSGEQRKDTCPAAFAHVGFKVSRSQSDARSGGAWETQAQPAAWGSQAGRSHTSHAAKRHVPAPHEGQMEPIQ